MEAGACIEMSVINGSRLSVIGGPRRCGFATSGCELRTPFAAYQASTLFALGTSDSEHLSIKS